METKPSNRNLIRAMTAAASLWEAIDTPISLSLFLKMKYQGLQSILQVTINPMDYNDSYSFRLDYQAVEYVRKIAVPFLGNLPKDNALNSFLAAEQSCLESNLRLRSTKPSSLDISISESIRHMLAPFWRQDFYEGRLGKGSTVSITKNTSAHWKFNELEPTITFELANFLLNTEAGKFIATENSRMLAHQQFQCIENLPGDEGLLPNTFGPLVLKRFSIVPGSRFGMVPKTAMTHRSICIEPSVNMFLQLGVGAAFKRCLLITRQVKLSAEKEDVIGDLRNIGAKPSTILLQEQRNKILAREASVSGSYSTIDLQSASDSISSEVIKRLFPSTIVDYLDVLRSKTVLINGKPHPFNKWSSMGNGYTFELETILFRGIAEGVGKLYSILPNQIHVYGDDIIVPTIMAEPLIEALISYGFKTNSRKTFVKGPFRESCGGDYFLGQDVRPIYLKVEELETRQSIYRLLNSIRRIALNFGGLGFCNSQYRPGWEYFLQWVSRRERSYGPDYTGDMTIHTEHSMYKHRWSQKYYSGWTLGYSARAVGINPPDSFRSMISAMLYGASSKVTSRNVYRFVKKPILLTVKIHNSLEWK